MLYVIHVICLCMPPQNYMINTSIDAKSKKIMPFFMSFHSGLTKCPQMWTFVLSAIKVILIKMYYLMC